MFLDCAVVSKDTRPGLRQAHMRPGIEQHGFYPFHPIGPDPIPELHQGCRFQNLATLKRIEPTETLPVGILMEHLNRPLVGTIIPVLENVNADHQSNWLSLTAQRTIVNRQGIMKAVPVNQTSGTEQLMLQIEDIRKQGFRHTKFPLWNMYFYISNLLHNP